VLAVRRLGAGQGRAGQGRDGLEVLPAHACCGILVTYLDPILFFQRVQVMGQECINRQLPMLPAALIDLASLVCPF